MRKTLAAQNDFCFYMILSATQDESYDSLRMVIRAAKMMLMFIE